MDMMTSHLELISFEIAGQEFCIDIRAVREIRGWTPATAMPQTPAWLLGVINLRGLVMPVIDLRARLGLGVTEPSSRHVIVVVQQGDRTAGLLVDAVQETFVVDETKLQPPPALGEAGGPRFVDAILALGEAGGPRFVDAILPIEGRMLSRLVVGALLPAEERLAM